MPGLFLFYTKMSNEQIGGSVFVNIDTIFTDLPITNRVWNAKNIDCFLQYLKLPLNGVLSLKNQRLSA